MLFRECFYFVAIVFSSKPSFLLPIPRWLAVRFVVGFVSGIHTSSTCTAADDEEWDAEIFTTESTVDWETKQCAVEPATDDDKRRFQRLLGTQDRVRGVTVEAQGGGRRVRVRVHVRVQAEQRATDRPKLPDGVVEQCKHAAALLGPIQ